MKKWLLRIVYAALVLLPVGAVADYTATQGTGSTIFAFVCFTTKICPAHVLTNSAGTEIATSGNPVRTDPTGTTTQPVSAASLPLPTGAAQSANQPTNAAQGSTTSGQTGHLVECAVTTAAPTYTTAQTDPLSCDTAGNLRVNVTNANANGPAAPASASPVTPSNKPVGAANLATGPANITTTATQILAARTGVAGTGRQSATVVNTGTTPVYIGGSGVTAPLATPVNSAFSTSTTGGSLAAATYYYRVSATNSIGETLASTETSQITTGTTSTVTVNWGAVTGATGYKVYGRTTGAELLIASVGAVTTYTDTGSITPSGALPTGNTTGSGQYLAGVVGASMTIEYQGALYGIVASGNQVIQFHETY
jgi:hypothetical protein